MEHDSESDYLFHYFDRFLAEYEGRFKFARIRCPDCQAEHLLMFSCRTRGSYPSCHAKRMEEWGE